jgi:uncharacterized protein YdhG (YjbR/CyaY superfamily)
MDGKARFTNIDEYIATFPEETQKALKEMRAIIKAAAPKATEKISYQMPTFYLNGNLVYFAAWKSHIGFYPVTSGIKAFENELASYEVSKGTIKFPLGKPLPRKLITKMVKFRVEENQNKAEAKTAKKKK